MALQTITLTSETEGMRASDLLRRLFPDLPESSLRKLFSNRDVKIDGKRIPSSETVHSGQLLQVYLPDLRSVETGSLRIVYEDADVLLVNKPAGISVETDSAGGLSLTELCRLQAEPGIVPGFPAPCHRLDVRTSGLCLFA